MNSLCICGVDSVPYAYTHARTDAHISFLFCLGHFCHCLRSVCVDEQTVIPMCSSLCCSTGGASHVWLAWPKCEADTCTFSQDVYMSVRCGVHAQCELGCPDIWAGGGWVRGALKAGMDKVKNPSWKFHIHQGWERERKSVWTICSVIVICWSD